MTPETALEISRQAILMVLTVAGPFLAASMLVGLAVSLVQAATQVHEATLSFVPKILAIFAMLLGLGGFMIQELVEFTARLFAMISVGP